MVVMLQGFRDIKLSYEGEGDLLGVRTLFARYPGTSSFSIVKALAQKNRVGAFYFTLDENAVEQEVLDVAQMARDLNEVVTIEAPGLVAFPVAVQDRWSLHFVRFFLNFETCTSLDVFKGFIK